MLMQVQSNKRKLDNQNDAYLWHARLGHISKNRISKMVAFSLLKVSNLEDLPTCESYLKGKMTEALFVGHPERSTSLLDLIHIDI